MQQYRWFTFDVMVATLVDQKIGFLNKQQHGGNKNHLYSMLSLYDPDLQRSSQQFLSIVENDG